MIYAITAQSRQSAGDPDGARRAAGTAAVWFWISLALLLAFPLLSFFFGIFENGFHFSYP